jgi:hypothetical protein
MSPNFRSSNTKNFFRRATSRKPRTVRSVKSETMSACVLRMQMASPTSSASVSSSEVDVTSAETQRFVFLTAIRRSRYDVRRGVPGSRSRSLYDW